MKILGSYINGNYKTTIYSDGTKIRETEYEAFIPEHCENIDIKITDYCDMNCPYCHENSSTSGIHADILHQDFINTLHPFTELAIGGGNPISHPDIIPFLEKLKERNIIPNLTVNQKHFLDSQDMLLDLVNRKLVYGIGVSLTFVTKELIYALQKFPNVVLHVINGIVDIDSLTQLYDQDFKILILGYKQFRRGVTYFSNKVALNKSRLYDELSKIINHFKVVSFDNLALDQLNVKRLLTDKQWEEFFMGDDGQYTMYIDAVRKEFARNSTATTRFAITDNIDDMFKTVKELKG